MREHRESPATEAAALVLQQEQAEASRTAEEPKSGKGCQARRLRLQRSGAVRL